MAGLLKSLDSSARAMMLGGMRDRHGLVMSCPCCGRTYTMANRQVKNNTVYLVCDKVVCQYETEIGKVGVNHG